MKLGIVDVGGGLRGVYAAGVLDRCMDEGVGCDVFVGVSAGSANGTSFIAGQRGRNLRFFTEFSQRKEYMSLENALKKRGYLDLDYIYTTLSNEGGECPLDYDAIERSNTELIVVASNAQKGTAKYFTKADIRRNDYAIMKASSAIPFVCRPYEVDGERYYDGALADPVPVKKALELGCDKVILILTKPKDLKRVPGKDNTLARLVERRYPLAAKNLRLRAKRYNDGVSYAKKLEEEGKALILAPDDTCGVDTLTKDVDALMRLYEKGYSDGERIKAFVG